MRAQLPFASIWNERMPQGDPYATKRLIAVTLDEASIGRGNPDQEHERTIAIYDLIEDNRFELSVEHAGPYTLHIALHEAKLIFDIRSEQGQPLAAHILSLTPFRPLFKDYFMMCESYYAAIRTATPTQIEAIDMGRRGLHNEGSELLKELLEPEAIVDFDTARRLFSLICVLHMKG